MNNFLSAAVDSEMLLEGLKNMLVGLAVVFCILILLSLIIYCFKFLGNIGAKDAAGEAPKAPKSAPAPKKAQGPGTMKETELDAEGVSPEVSAVILGAVAEECGGDFKVTSIKKID